MWGFQQGWRKEGRKEEEQEASTLRTLQAQLLGMWDVDIQGSTEQGPGAFGDGTTEHREQGQHSTLLLTLRHVARRGAGAHILRPAAPGRDVQQGTGGPAP